MVNKRKIDNMVNKRKSNLEMLRIIAMMMVLLCHYTYTRDILNGGGKLLDVTNLLFSVSNVLLRSIFFIGVHCFVLISGYFGITFKSRSFFNLIFQMMFWSFICTLMGYLPSFGVGEFSFLKVFTTQIVIPWFPQAYLILFILSPLLNAFIERNPTESLGKYIILFYLLSTIGGYMLHWKDFDEGMSPLSLVGIYMIGAYLRRSELRIFKMKKEMDLLVWGLGALFMMALNLLLFYAGINICPYGYLNPIIILMAIFFFLFFVKLDIGSIPWINYVATIVFSVYLAHSHCFTRPMVVEGWRWINTSCGMYLSIPMALLSFVALFMLCLPIDRLRIWIFNRFYDRIKG